MLLSDGFFGEVVQLRGKQGRKGEGKRGHGSNSRNPRSNVANFRFISLQRMQLKSGQFNFQTLDFFFQLFTSWRDLTVGLASLSLKIVKILVLVQSLNIGVCTVPELMPRSRSSFFRYWPIYPLCLRYEFCRKRIIKKQ